MGGYLSDVLVTFFNCKLSHCKQFESLYYGYGEVTYGPKFDIQFKAISNIKSERRKIEKSKMSDTSLTHPPYSL